MHLMLSEVVWAKWYGLGGVLEAFRSAVLLFRNHA